MTVSDRKVALEKAVTAIHCLARDMEHDIHTPWKINDDLTASTCCRRCGSDAAVRVYPDGRVWTGGGLTYEHPCGSPRPKPNYSKARR